MKSNRRVVFRAENLFELVLMEFILDGHRSPGRSSSLPAFFRDEFSLRAARTVRDYDSAW